MGRLGLQLQLQRAVEGLSVIAISYYAVNLLAGLMHPLADAAGFSKSQLTAGLVLPVVVLVAVLIRRLRLGDRNKDRENDG